MTRHLIIPSGEAIDLHALGAADALARLVVDLAAQLDEITTGQSDTLPYAELRQLFDESRERAKSHYGRWKYYEAKSQERWQTVCELRAELRDRNKEIARLEAGLVEQGIRPADAGPKIGRPEKDGRKHLTNTEVLRVFLSDLRGRLLAEARRNPSLAVKTGLQLAAREVQTFSHGLPGQRGAA